MRSGSDSPAPASLIAYCALHESNGITPRGDYTATMLEFHERIRRESARLEAERSRFIEDSQLRELNALRGSLGEFLQTPLRADKEEIAKAILAAFRRIRETSFPREAPGLTVSTEGEVVALPHGQPPLRKLGLNGSRYLSDLGFTPIQKGGAVFESTFIVKGGENLDVLEHIVRDVLGIYATTHGKHLREFGNYSYTLYNLVKSVTPERRQGEPEFEATFFFAKPGPEIVKYAPFRNALVSLMESMGKELALPGIELWQRKLGLGPGVEFALRVNLAKEEMVDDVANWLKQYSENPIIHRALAVDARLIMKKLSLLQSLSAE